MNCLYSLRRIHGILHNFRMKLSERVWLSIHKINIMTSEETVEYIIDNHCSVSRYGDGELNLIFNNSFEIGFQSRNPELSKRLEEILCATDSSNILLSLPHHIISQDGLTPYAEKFWKQWVSNYYKFLYRLLYKKTNKVCFGDTNMTRPYIDYNDKSKSERLFNMLKEIWKGQQLLIVEGDKTRLGVGNDLFEGANEIQRIIAPSINAYDKYDSILDAVKNNYSGGIVLIALGPTATVLAYDLSKQNIWAIDIGHIDIEYEWYLAKATDKIPIKGKAVNEVEGGYDCSVFEDEKYNSQIVERII